MPWVRYPARGRTPGVLIVVAFTGATCAEFHRVNPNRPIPTHGKFVSTGLGEMESSAPGRQISVGQSGRLQP